jgi:hypothetical protein
VPFSGLVETFAEGFTPYSVVSGGPSLDNLEIVSTDYGLGMQVTSDTLVTGVRIRRSIVTNTPDEIRLKFMILSVGEEDAGRVALTDSSGTIIVELVPVREQQVDALRRAHINPPESGAGQHLSDAALSTGVWYQFTASFDWSALQLTCTLTRDGGSVGSVVVALSSTHTVTYLEFASDGVADSGTSQSVVTDIRIDGETTVGDLNAVHIIRECLTDLDWGLGYPEADIDDTAFQAAADTLYDEGFGLSLLWDRQIPIEDFIREICKHIDANVYPDLATGEWTIKLIRDDYSVGGLTTLDPSNVERVEGWTRPALDELVNSVTVRYWDASTGADASVPLQDSAAVQMQGAEIAQTLSYPGITSAALATRVAQRDLRALSTPLASCTLYTHRAAVAGLGPGSAFLYSWPDYGASLVMRVTELAYGRDTAVRLKCAEDVFGLPTVSVLDEPESEWTPPGSAPTAATVRLVTEAPYWELVQRLGEAAAEDRLAANPDAGFLLASAGRPSSGAVHAAMQVDAGAGYAETAVVDFCPVAELVDPIDETDNALVLTGAVDIDLVTLGTHGQIDDELVEIVAISTTAATIARGVLDTVPAAHAAGAKLICWDAYAGSDPTEYVTAEALDVKLLPVTGTGTLEASDAPVDSVTMDQRALRPYPPGKVRVNGDAYPVEVVGLMTVTWAHRDRLQQTATLVDEGEASIGPEDGTTYSVEVYGNGDLLRHTETGITGTSWAEDSGDGVGNGDLTVKVWSVRDALASLYQAVVATWRDGALPAWWGGRGVWGGGTTGSNSDVLDYVAIATPGNATDFGDLTVARLGPGACSDGATGVWGGGNTGSGSNVLDYVTIATPGNATDFGDLTVARLGPGACSDGATGVWGGGHAGTQLNVLDYVTIATPGNATDFGDLTVARYHVSACASSTRGIWGGGVGSVSSYNNLDYVTIATPSNATDFGDLSVARPGIGATSDGSRGVWGGGYTTPGVVSSNIIDYVAIATPGNATDFGDLTVARHWLAVTSGD